MGIFLCCEKYVTFVHSHDDAELRVYLDFRGDSEYELVNNCWYTMILGDLDSSLFIVKWMRTL